MPKEHKKHKSHRSHSKERHHKDSKYERSKEKSSYWNEEYKTTDYSYSKNKTYTEKRERDYSTDRNRKDDRSYRDNSYSNKNSYVKESSSNSRTEYHHRYSEDCVEKSYSKSKYVKTSIEDGYYRIDSSSKEAYDRYSSDSLWSKYAKVYDPITVGSIDGTDTEPHDNAVWRAVNAEYKPNKLVKGEPHRTLFVARLNPKTTQVKIEETFSKYGKIVRCRLLKDIVTGASKGYAFVEYDFSKSTSQAYKEMNKTYIDGAEILVDYEMERSMEGWKPRRLGGGFGGKKESGQLRFGCRDRPFLKPILMDVKR